MVYGSGGRRVKASLNYQIGRAGTIRRRLREKWHRDPIRTDLLYFESVFMG
jgi:hypothetical protein